MVLNIYNVVFVFRYHLQCNMSNVSLVNTFESTYYNIKAKENMHYSHVVALLLTAVIILSLCLLILYLMYRYKMRHDINFSMELNQARADV